jgi:DNA invertase Pin-like site-specific DNA recombinase
VTDLVAQQGSRGRRRRAGDPALVVAYVRVSTDEQLLGPEAQRTAIEHWCAARGARLVAVLEDLGVSGGASLDRRPGLQRALDTLRAQRAGVLLVAKRDRLARDVVVAALVERFVQRAGAQVLSADGAGNGEGPEASLMRTMVNAFAEYERALIGARTRAALARKKARGEKTGGAAPYGFRVGADGVHLEVAPDEAAAVALARALRARGLTLAAIARELESKGLRPRSGRAWHPMTLARALAAA